MVCPPRQKSNIKIENVKNHGLAAPNHYIACVIGRNADTTSTAPFHLSERFGGHSPSSCSVQAKPWQKRDTSRALSDHIRGNRAAAKDQPCATTEWNHVSERQC